MPKHTAVIEHSDIKGRPIRVGTEIAFGLPGTHRMGLGVVTKINPKTITVSRKEVATWMGDRTVFDALYVRHPEHCCLPRDPEEPEVHHGE